MHTTYVILTSCILLLFIITIPVSLVLVTLYVPSQTASNSHAKSPLKGMECATCGDLCDDADDVWQGGGDWKGNKEVCEQYGCLEEITDERGQKKWTVLGDIKRCWVDT